jgi:hypothetical protein
MAETLASHHRQRPVVDLVGPVARVDRAVGRERSVWVRLVVAVDTLLGPEKTTTVCIAVCTAVCGFSCGRSSPEPERHSVVPLWVWWVFAGWLWWWLCVC